MDVNVATHALHQARMPWQNVQRAPRRVRIAYVVTTIHVAKHEVSTSTNKADDVWHHKSQRRRPYPV